MASTSNPPAEVAEGLRLLGVERLAFVIHDASFPAGSLDTGRGTPYGAAGWQLLAFVRSLGFDTLQLGPQGRTTPGNPSPYDSTAFSRDEPGIDLSALVEDPRFGGLLDAAVLDSIAAGEVVGDGLRALHEAAHRISSRALDAAHERFVARCVAAEPRALEVAREIETFRGVHAGWLGPDACQANQSLERCAFAQWIAREQHGRLRSELSSMGMGIHGDLQVGLGPADVASRRALWLSGYLMGAPPSRTNPEGQPWGYPVLDPGLYRASDGGEGPAVAFLGERVGAMLDLYDGLRVDHPHGLVCPWVYRSDDPDPRHAVQHGARLFSSPDLSDHPALADHAIARPDQIEVREPRHADGRVRGLAPQQVARYAVIFDRIVQEVRARGRDAHSLAVEVLSTCPTPLQLVLARHGLGRFRITQKADVTRADDVYRTDNAKPEDWVMLGTHDTPPLWRLARGWCGSEEGRARARYLASRLAPGAQAGRFAQQLAEDPRKLVHAEVADLFACDARHVMIFFTDLFGLDESYNVPGTVGPDNWSLRVPPDWLERYHRGAATGETLDVSLALALGLRARIGDAQPGLVARLASRALSWWPDALGFSPAPG